MTAHKQWATRPADQRFTSLAALREAVHNRRMRSKGVNRSVTDLHVTVQNESLILNSNISPTEPTHWSFGQLCGVAKAPASYLRTLSPELTAENLNYSIQRAPKDEFQLMTVVEPSGGVNTLQAVTSTKYGRIWDCDVVDAIQRVVDRSGGKFYNPKAYVRGGSGATEPSGLYASDHDVFAFMVDGGSLLNAGPRATLNRGFIVWNSETGAKTLGIQTFLFNQCCGNHIIWGAHDIQTLLIRHNSGAPARFDREVTPILAQYVNASAKPMEDSIRRSQRLMLTNVVPSLDGKLGDGWITAFAKKFSFTRGEVRDAIDSANREEGQCASMWDMVQGLTASARDYQFIDARLDLETRAGKLLDATPIESAPVISV